MREIASTLSERGAAFVRETVDGCKPIVAAERAGYSHPDHAAYLLRSNPQVQAAIATGLRRFLYTDAAPQALKMLYTFMNREDLDPKLRVQCAKTLADRAGFIPPKAKDNSALDSKSFTEMSAEELREASQRIVKELSDRSVTVIDNAPSGDPNSDEAIDLFG